MMAIFVVKRAAILIPVSAFFASADIKKMTGNPQLNGVNGKSCGEDQFACRNGDCIASESLCDGRADCSDQSDETQAECLKPWLICPDYAFRCNYGACVDGDAACNGVKDCIDNSDEALTRCPGIAVADPQASCGLEDFRCKNGQCVNSTSLCDGTVDCADRSDETALVCGSLPHSGIQMTTIKSAVRLRLRAQTSLSLRRSPCVVPPHPSNGRWKLHQSLCNSDIDCDIPQGTQLEPASQLVYTCNPNYKTKGSTDVFCRAVGTWTTIPMCVETKCSTLNSPSTEASCTLSGRWVNCDLAVFSGTQADVSCRNGYKKETYPLTDLSEHVVCNSDGKWEPELTKCILVCGIGVTQPTLLVANGVTATVENNYYSSPKTSVQPPLSPMTTTTSTTTENQIDSQVPSRAAVLSCKVPPQPANGQWKLHPSICEGVTDCTVPQGTALRPGDQLVHSCMPGFRINGSPDVYCRRQGFWSPIPTCTEVTCHALESASMIATCYRFNKWQSCNSSVLPNTTAELTCRRAYKEDGSLLNAGRKTVTCSTDGKWEPRPITCLPVCGIANVQLTPTILNGSPADIVDFPWHATLYRRERPPQGTKEFKCGATIVQHNILLTAAHCVYDERFHVAEKPERFHVLTGNKFRDYDFPYHDPRIVRKAAVKSIHVPCEYSGLDGNYGSDVAILELEKPFRLSDILMPASMDVLGNNEQLLESGSVGRFAGFGRTESGTSSGILLTTNVAYVSYRKCKMSDGSKDNVGLISNDKFCGEGQNGMAVCQGDSSGGLVFNGDGRWHLMGILSANLGVNISNGEKTCDSNAYSLHTKVSSHVPWISKVVYSLQRYQYYPPCSSHPL